MRGSRARRGGRPPVDFDGFDFSGFQGGPGSTRRGSRAGAGRQVGQLQRHLLRHLLGAQQPQQPRGPQPGTDLEYQATVDFWTAIRGGQARIQVNRQETCPTCHGQAHTGGPMQCPECNGTGQVTQMGGRMKFNIPCPRCNGTGRTSNDVRDLPRRRRGEPKRDGGVPHQGGDARRAADPAAGQGQRGRERRAGRATCS